MFCLRKELADVFRGKIQSGEIDPKTMSEMTSAQRMGYFSSFMDVANAKEVNALIDSKLLLKNQEQGLINAMQQILGQKPSILRDVLSKINRIDKILSPEDKEKFMGDVIAKKLGLPGEVTPEEGKKIADLAQKANDAKKELDKYPSDMDRRIDYGKARQDVIDYIDSLKPHGNPFLNFSNWWNLPKSSLTSILHFSAPLVQGWGLMSTKAFWKALPRMFTYYSKEKYDTLNAFITTHPDYNLAVKSKLGLTKVSDKLSMREEAIQSSILEHIPGLKEIVKGSSRAFTGFLNDARFGRYTDLLNAARLKGLDLSNESELPKQIADVVNNFSGRAALGDNDKYASSQALLNNIFFSPRKILATINMFNPEKYVNTSAFAREAAIKQLAGSLIATFAFIQLAHLAGAEVDLDPRSQKFGKIKFGETTFDITGGNAIYGRMIARVASGQTKTSWGEIRNLTLKERQDEIIQYFKNKLAPTDSAILDTINNAIAGKPLGIGKRAADEMTPIFIGDMINLVRYDGQNTAAYLASPLAMLGAAMYTKEPGSEWGMSQSKVLTQFKEKVGEEKFVKANEEFDKKFDEWVNKEKSSSYFKKLSPDDKQEYVKTERNKIEKEVLREHGFIYREKKKRFSIRE